MSRESLLVAPRDLRLVPVPDRPLQANEVRAEAVVSGISHGTELNLYRGTSPFDRRRFDPELRLFVEDLTSQPYPMRLGYEWVGRVAEIGAEVTTWKVGDLVHLPVNHRESAIFTAGERTGLGAVEPLPAGMAPENAALIALAGVALQAIHDAHIKLGDRVVIFGLGTIGLLALQLARLDGAAWVDAVDPLPRRRALAAAYGADRVFDPNAGDVARAIKEASPQHGADVAVEVSGHYPALHEALRSARMGGTIVAAGYYQGGGTPLRLGEEWHHNRLTLVSSMGVWDCTHRDHPAWNRGRVHATVTDLLAMGRLRADGMITHRIPFERAAEAFDLIDRRPEDVVKVVLTY